MPLARKILDSGKPFVLFHTYSVTEDLLRQAIDEIKSMDLDVCVNEQGEPYIGHSSEYHEKSGDPWEPNMPLWDAVDMISNSVIPVIVDCKHPDAWPVVAEVVTRIGPERCLVHSFATELKFDYSRRHGEPDFITEWSPIEKLLSLKTNLPSVSTCASAKWLPDDLLESDRYTSLLDIIRRILKDNRVDTVCLNVPAKTMSDECLRFFLDENIIPHVEVDGLVLSRFSEVFIGETDHLKLATKCTFF